MIKATLEKIFLPLISILITLIIADFAVYGWYKFNNLELTDREQTKITRELQLRSSSKEQLSTVASNKRPVILFIGDSFTYGQELNDDETFPSQVQKLLKNKTLNINVGFGGHNIVDHSLALDRYLTQVTPDLVVVTITSNDYFFDSWNLSAYDVCPNMTSHKIKRFMIKHSNLYHFFYHQFNEKTLPSGDEKRAFDPFQKCASIYFKQIKNKLDKKGIKYIFAYHRDSLKHHKFCARYDSMKNDFLKNFIRLYGETPIFLTPEVLSSDCKKSESFYLDDNYHLNAEANRLFAKKLLPHIKSKLNLN